MVETNQRRLDYEYLLHSLRGLFHPGFETAGEPRPIGKWGHMYRDYLKEHRPIQFNALVLSGSLWTYLADLNEQVQQRIETLIT